MAEPVLRNGFRSRATQGYDLSTGTLSGQPRPTPQFAMLKTLDLRATDDPRDIIHRTVQALVEGQVVGIPTDTVYGLAADALSETAVEELVRLKGRQFDMPLAISVGSRESAEDFLCKSSPLVRKSCFCTGMQEPSSSKTY